MINRTYSRKSKIAVAIWIILSYPIGIGMLYFTSWFAAHCIHEDWTGFPSLIVAFLFFAISLSIPIASTIWGSAYIREDF